MAWVAEELCHQVYQHQRSIRIIVPSFRRRLVLLKGLYECFLEKVHKFYIFIKNILRIDSRKGLFSRKIQWKNRRILWTYPIILMTKSQYLSSQITQLFDNILSLRKITSLNISDKTWARRYINNSRINAFKEIKNIYCTWSNTFLDYNY